MKKIGFIGNELEKMKKSDETQNASIKCIDWSLDETYIRTIKNFSKVLWGSVQTSDEIMEEMMDSKHWWVPIQL